MIRKLFPFVLIIAGLTFTGCSLTEGINQNNNTTVTPSTDSTPSGYENEDPFSNSEPLNNLNLELNQTIDDGGQSDIKQLEKESAGL